MRKEATDDIIFDGITTSLIDYFLKWNEQNARQRSHLILIFPFAEFSLKR
jgi:hypothetical protein